MINQVKLDYNFDAFLNADYSVHEGSCRANMYLQDWKVGHLIQYQEHDKQWHNSTHWSAGDGYIWDHNHLHLSVNAGMSPKYTLQISGFLNG